ncbi:hypothetical protein ACHAQA_005104 [Verticillium albo-atrum]
MAPQQQNKGSTAKSAEKEIAARGSSSSGAGRTPQEGASGNDAQGHQETQSSGSGKEDAARPGKKGKQPSGGENSDGSQVTGGKPLRLKKLAEEKLDGKAGNPSQLGDPISLEVEDGKKTGKKGDIADGQRGAPGRESKL